ncbi:MAG: ferredoxin [Lentisphaeraceae bacterium]|nr:ferredoxin [Lentisphaeraceae bacterium]
MLNISHKRPECIGCGLCAEAAPNYWKMSSDGLATLLDIKHRRKQFHYADGFEEDSDILQKAVEGCPVQIIAVN